MRRRAALTAIGLSVTSSILIASGGVASSNATSAVPPDALVDICDPLFEPVLGTLFDGDDVPIDGHITQSDRPGFGLTLRRDAVHLARPFSGG